MHFVKFDGLKAGTKCASVSRSLSFSSLSLYSHLLSLILEEIYPTKKPYTHIPTHTHTLKTQ